MSYFKTTLVALVILFASVIPASADSIPEQVVSWFESNVVKIIVGRGTGSGFFVAPDTIVTACHVVEGWHGAMITQVDSTKRYATTIKACDTINDLAVLKVRDVILDSVYTELATKLPRVGEQTYGAGYPLGMPLLIVEGHWQRVSPYGKENYTNTTYTLPGDSGSPLVIWEDGLVKVVGVRVAMLEAGEPNNQHLFPHISFIVPVTILQEFLDETK